MRKSIARTALWNALLLGAWIFFFDLLIDLLVINLADFAWLHLLLVLSSVLVLFVSLRRDLLARERAEIALQRSHEQLEQRVRDRTTELNLTVEKLYAEIAERARAEEALRKLSRAVEHSPATVVITDTAGNIEYVNPRFTQTTGYSIDEVRGKNPRILRSGQTPAEVYAQLWSTILAGGQWQGELCNKKKSGELYWESTHISSITDENGAMTHFVAVKEDITERKRVEQQANRLAVLEERQHLSRELHDSLSQALYGISLGAQTAAKWLDRDRARVVEALQYVITLADAGLTEMRALIFELRPESLAREGLLNALTKQASAVGARNSLPVEIDLCGREPDVPLDVKDAIYRIAQEALHNAAKHARAGRLRLHFTCQDDRLMLDVGDDGVGFDPAGPHPGHLGLHSMRERATRAGGLLSIDSVPGRGTCVHAEFPLRAV